MNLTDNELNILKSLPHYNEKSNWGYVYVCTNSIFLENDLDIVKIGYTQNPYKRLVVDPYTSKNDIFVKF